MSDEMFQFIEKFLTIYGPLGMGWVFFTIILIRLWKVEDFARDAQIETARALSLLAERIGGNSYRGGGGE